jgi:hypothetical protein
MKTYKLICSINAYQENALNLLIDNFKEHIEEDFILIINCSTDLHGKLQSSDLLESNKNIILNPKPFDKARYHGSLTRGIVSNINFALNTFKNWEQLIILSNCYFFEKNINLKLINEAQQELLNRASDFWLNKGVHQEYTCGPAPAFIPSKYLVREQPDEGFFWPEWKGTKLAKYFWDKPSWCGKHEGLVFNRECCSYISRFLKREKDITEDLFNFNSNVEEFSLHTLAVNSGGKYGHLSFDRLNEFTYVYRKPKDEIYLTGTYT